MGIALLAVGAACVGALHVVHALRADLAPWRHRLSEYANAAAGGLMTVAFIALGIALAALAPIVAHRRWLVAVAVWIGGAGLVASGVFRTGVTEAGATSDSLHALASSTATVAMVVAVAASRRRMAALVAVALLLASPFSHGTIVGGLNQRLLWGTLLAWCVTSARTRDDLSAPSAPSPTIVA